jgi:CheY-like chemotaxis protein
VLQGFGPLSVIGDFRLSRRRGVWDSVMAAVLAAPLRCRTCARRFYKRVSAAQLPPRTALGCSHSVRSLVLAGAEQRTPTVLVIDDLKPFSKLIREALAPRGFAVFGAKTPDEGLALFQAHREEIDLAVIDLMTQAEGNLDLAAEFERLRPGLPVLYLFGEAESIARCSIQKQAPGSVLAAPFTAEQLIARVGSILLDVEPAALQRSSEQRWERLIAASDRMLLSTGR